MMALVQLRKVSASQISTYLDCPRKWAYSRHLPEGEKAWLILGTKVHAVLARWLALGVPPNPNTKEGKIALQGLHHLPQPMSPGLVIEGQRVADPSARFDEDYNDQADSPRRFRFVVDGVVYTGQADIYHPVPSWSPIIGDHKTTSGRGWIKVGEILRYDPQAIGYAMFAITRGKGEALEVRLRWIYYYTDGSGRSEVVDLVVPAQNVLQSFAEMHTTVGKHLAFCSDDPNLHPRNYRSCSKYGGCPYRGPCYEGTSPFDRLEAILGDVTS